MAEKASYKIEGNKVIKTTKIEFDLNNFTDKLRLYLDLSDMTVEQLAKEFMVNSNTIYNWMSEKTIPRESLAERVQNRLEEILDVLDIKEAPSMKPIVVEQKKIICKDCKHAYKHKLSDNVSVLYCNHMTQCDATCIWAEEIK